MVTPQPYVWPHGLLAHHVEAVQMARASLAGGGQPWRARHTSSSRSLLHDSQRGPSEGQAAQPVRQRR